METTKKKLPLQRQYDSIKAKYPDAVLLFRVGDYYESFGPDAKIVSEVLELPLVERPADQYNDEPVQLAGFPAERLQGWDYLTKLVKAGNRVALCDQLEDPTKAVNFKRDVK